MLSCVELGPAPAAKATRLLLEGRRSGGSVQRPVHMDGRSLSAIAASLVLAAASARAEDGPPAVQGWEEWATAWLDADAMIRGANTTRDALVALGRRADAEARLAEPKVSESTIASALASDPPRRRRALAVVIARRSAADEVVEVILSRAKGDDDVTRLYAVVALRAVSSRQLELLEERTAALVMAEPSALILAEALPVVGRLQASRHAGLYGRYFEHEDPRLQRLAFAALAGAGEGAVEAVVLQLRRDGRTTALSNLCARVGTLEARMTTVSQRCRGS